jgi:hypothetical protein
VHDFGNVGSVHHGKNSECRVAYHHCIPGGYSLSLVTRGNMTYGMQDLMVTGMLI